MRFFGVLLCLATLGLTGYSALSFKAPKIQADIEERTREALSSLEVDGVAENVALRVDGRQITLEGPVADDQQRQMILDAVSSVPGVFRTVDRLNLSNVMSPYRLGAVKDQRGDVAIAGYAPNETARAAIMADARALFGADASITIDLADGAPTKDWQVAAAAALDALATTRQGSLSISDQDVQLDGKVTAEADIEAIQLFAAMLPEGYRWSDEIGVADENDDASTALLEGSSPLAGIGVAPAISGNGGEELARHEGSTAGQVEGATSGGGGDPISTERRRVEPYTFSVVKDRRSGLFLKGFAPDEAARAALIDAGKAVGDGRPVIADIEIADGVPDDDWLSMVQAGISAMQDMQPGRLEIVDGDVAFTSDPETEATAAAVTLDDQNLETVADAAVPAADTPSVDLAIQPASGPIEVGTLALTVDKVEEDVWSIRGLVPSRDAEEELVALIKEHAGVNDIDVELLHRDGDADDDWVRFANDHIPTLDVVRAGRLQLEGRKAHLIGVVETPEDIEPVQAVLASINDDMTVDLQPVDPRPVVTLSLKVEAGSEVTLSGALPKGLSEEEAMHALGITRYEGELGEAASGAVETWRRELAAIGPFLPIFEEIDLTFGDGPPKLNGDVQIHADAASVAEEIGRALGDDRRPLLGIATTSTVYADGDTRSNPLTGEKEAHRGGYWLPLVDIVADQETCRARSSALLATEKITFLRGQEALDQRAERILNALAGLAIACLEPGDLVLEIGGHTDARGTAQMNQDLSQARADAVLNALAARGVNVDALIAVGHGERRPIADNGTDGGRAANRRITFEWSVANEAKGLDVKS